jgi:thymidylate kinase
MERVLKNYHELWAQHASEPRWAVINARGTVEETAALINAVVARHREVAR